MENIFFIKLKKNLYLDHWLFLFLVIISLLIVVEFALKKLIIDLSYTMCLNTNMFLAFNHFFELQHPLDIDRFWTCSRLHGTFFSIVSIFYMKIFMWIETVELCWSKFLNEPNGSIEKLLVHLIIDTCMKHYSLRWSISVLTLW